MSGGGPDSDLDSDEEDLEAEEDAGGDGDEEEKKDGDGEEKDGEEKKDGDGEEKKDGDEGGDAEEKKEDEERPAEEPKELSKAEKKKLAAKKEKEEKAKAKKEAKEAAKKKKEKKKKKLTKEEVEELKKKKKAERIKRDALKAKAYAESPEGRSSILDDTSVNDDFLVDAADDWHRPRNRVLVPKVGKFDIHWPDGQPAPILLSVPAFRPNELPHPDIARLLKAPKADSGSGRFVRGGRRQIGWVLFEMPSKRWPRVLLRLPCYVSEEVVAMSHLEASDFGSPWNPLNNDYYRHPEDAFAQPKEQTTQLGGFLGKKKS